MEQDTFKLSAKRLSIREMLHQLHYYRTSWKIAFSILLAITFVPFVVVLLFPAALRDGGALLFFFVLTAFGLGGLYDMYREINESAAVSRFAAANKYQFIRDHRPADYLSTLFRAGAYVPFAVRSTNQYFTELGYFRQAQSQRRSSSAVTATYVRMKLPVQLPHIILRRQGSTAFVPGSGTLPDTTPFRLEGAFGNRYEVYAPKGYEQDVLYIFTPDVMERFLDAVQAFDCEIIGDEMYLYTQRKIRFLSPDVLNALIESLIHVRRKFDKQSVKYAQHNPVPVSATRSYRFSINFNTLLIITIVTYVLLACITVFVRQQVLQSQ